MTASDFFQSEIAHYAFVLALLLLTLAVVLYLFRRRIRNLWLKIKTHLVLKRLGLRQVSNYQCPDGLGHHFIVDRLLMHREGITLISFKRFPGSIFCAENINEWTQMLGGKSYKFKNPLVDLDYQIKAVSARIPGVPVDGFLFFDHTADFPKGHPDRVIHLDSIPQALRRNKEDRAPEKLVSAWETLVRQV